METTPAPQPSSDSSESAPLAARSRPVGPGHLLLLLVFLAIFGAASMRMDSLHRGAAATDLDAMELRSLQAVRDTGAEHDSPVRGGSAGFYQSWAPHHAWYGVPPLWPWLMSFGKPPRETSEDGRTLTEIAVENNSLPPWVEEMRRHVIHANQWLILSFLFLLGLGMWRHWGLLSTVNLSLILGWVVLRPFQDRATPETLSMILFLLTGLCSLRLVLKNSVWRHVHFGLVAGLAYLTDLSILPLLAAWLVVTTVRFVRGVFEKAPEGTWTCRAHFIGLLAMIFSFLAVTAPNLSFHRERDGRALFPALQRYEGITQLGAAQLRSRTLENLQTLVRRDAASANSSVEPSRALILFTLLALGVVSAACAASRGKSLFRQGRALNAESRSVFYLAALAAIFYAASEDPGRVLWQVFGLLAIVLTMATESLHSWVERWGGGWGLYRVLFTCLQLVLTVHLMFCMLRFSSGLPTHP